MANPILVTGAAGRAGGVGRTVTELLLKQVKAVRAMVRNERAQALRDMGAEVVVCDLLDLDSCGQAPANTPVRRSAYSWTADPDSGTLTVRHPSCGGFRLFRDALWTRIRHSVSTQGHAHQEEKMANVFFMKPLLEDLSEGHLFKKATALLLRVTAALTLVGTLVLWVQGWKAVGALAGVSILGGILFQCCFAVGSYFIVHVMWLRAQDIARLPKSEFTLIPIAYIGLKLAGEVYAAALVSINLGTGLLIWFASTEWGSVVRDLYVFLVPASWFGKEPFVQGATTILLGIAAAFGVLFLGYLLAESVVVVASIANDTRRLRAIAEQQSGGTAKAAGHQG